MGPLRSVFNTIAEKATNFSISGKGSKKGKFSYTNNPSSLKNKTTEVQQKIKMENKTNEIEEKILSIKSELKNTYINYQRKLYTQETFFSDIKAGENSLAVLENEVKNDPSLKNLEKSISQKLEKSILKVQNYVHEISQKETENIYNRDPSPIHPPRPTSHAPTFVKNSKTPESTPEKPNQSENKQSTTPTTLNPSTSRFTESTDAQKITLSIDLEAENANFFDNEINKLFTMETRESSIDGQGNKMPDYQAPAPQANKPPKPPKPPKPTAPKPKIPNWP